MAKNEAVARLQRETDARLVRDVEADLEGRQSLWTEARNAFVASEGKRLFDLWIQEMRERFNEEASETYSAEHPPWSFERAADVYLKSTMPKGSARASRIAELKALHEAKGTSRVAERDPLMAREGTILGTQGRQAGR